jgi:hypothetical protein
MTVGLSPPAGRHMSSAKIKQSFTTDAPGYQVNDTTTQFWEQR